MAQWKPGESGNPEGGRLNRAYLLRKQLLDAAPDVIAKTIELAKAGDPVALRLVLERVLPALRTEARLLELALPEGATLTEQAKALVEAAAKGELPTDHAAELVRALTGVVTVEQGDELRKRLEALEHADLA
ncbi:MAG: hypothetical protein U1F67_10430 [Rubrivivax sp.]